MWKWIKRLFGKPSATGPAPVSPSWPSESTTVSTSAPTISLKAFDERRLNTPNKSSRPITPSMIVLHHTSGSYNGSVSWCMNPGSKVSYHVIIARNGNRTVLADDTARCWHAGISSWQGVPDCNSYSLGVAWDGNTYSNPLAEDAMESALEYLVPRMKRWHIPMSRVVTHQQVSPGRKNDISPGDAARFKTRLKAALN
jgi:N-acetyl-anhydromuramyl-L-alanine amidase AmpD